MLKANRGQDAIWMFPMVEWKFYFETYGCKVNQHESQSIREAWQKLGGSETALPEEADYICINSCAITSKAERDARNAIYRLRRQASRAKIILTGCGAQLFETFKPLRNANYAKPDLCLPQGAKNALLFGPEHVLSAGRSPAKTTLSPPAHFNRARAIVKVQDGCKQNCTYCIVPKIRTDLYSEAPEKILEECRFLADNGHAELVISGINLRQYGKDRVECGDFWNMLAWLDKELAVDYADKLRLRISSIEPSQLDDEALHTLASCRLVCPHLHLSLQHASGKILRQMGRGHYRAEHVLDFTGRLASYWPTFALGADLLVGFPGEDERDLEELLAFIEVSAISYAHVFPYSARPGTVAGARRDQIPQKQRQERAELVRSVIKAKRQAFWQENLRMRGMAIAAERKPDAKTGRIRGINEYYVPCYMKEDVPCDGLVEVRPLQIIEEGLLVERLH